MKLKTIIVEDEILGQEALAGILAHYCHENVEVVDMVETVDEAIQSIRNNDPDLVFMDIKLCGNEHGAFDILKSFEEIRFKVVFTTSSDQPDNMLSAINKYGAKKYLLKPLDIDEVIEAVKVSRMEIESASLENEIMKIKKILHAFSGKEQAQQKFKIPIKHGFQCVSYDEVVMIRSHTNDTLFFLENGQTLKSSKNLRYFENELSHKDYCRVARSHIVNIKHLVRYSREDGGTIFLSNDCTAPLSDRYSKDFFKMIDF